MSATMPVRISITLPQSANVQPRLTLGQANAAWSLTDSDSFEVNLGETGVPGVTIENNAMYFDLNGSSQPGTIEVRATVGISNVKTFPEQMQVQWNPEMDGIQATMQFKESMEAVLLNPGENLVRTSD